MKCTDSEIYHLPGQLRDMANITFCVDSHRYSVVIIIISKIMVIIACYLIHADVTSFKIHDQWLLYLKIEVVDDLGSFLSGCLMQLAKIT